MPALAAVTWLLLISLAGGGAAAAASAGSATGPAAGQAAPPPVRAGSRSPAGQAGAASGAGTAASATSAGGAFWANAGASKVAPAAGVGRAYRAESDDYTRYELLAPESGQFHILYEVTAISPGATAYFNPIRKGSEASGEAVYDRATGRALAFEAVSGAEARRSGLPDADLEMAYLRIHLPRPVPPEGGVRLLIEKTYKDAKSYYRKDGGRIVFARPLGVRRNAIVLPAGYELVSCNVPSQVLPEPDGRTKVSFMHTGPEAAPLRIEARQLPGAAAEVQRAAQHALPTSATPRAQPAPGASPVPAAGRSPTAAGGDTTGQSEGGGPGKSSQVPGTGTAGRLESMERRLSERAHQDRTIVYFLRQPESHSFDLYHDYTETREGTDKYLNVVRKGSASSGASARILDTGEALRVETLRGDALLHAGLTAAELREATATPGGGAGAPGPPGPPGLPEGMAPDTEVVVAHFPPLRKGESLRLRIAETYTDAPSYRLDGDVMVFDRSFGRPRNAVVLPEGWYLTASAIPALVGETADGRIRLDWVNPRPDEIAVLIEARRRR